MRISDWSSDVCSSDLKRYTTTGMATDQGKMGNLNAIGIVADEIGRPLPEVGVTTFRPPYTPVTFGAFAGRDVDALLDPVWRTPMHGWHERNGALFEDVGQWRRAWYYPQHGEDRSEEHPSELQSLMRISYVVFRLKKTQH